MFTAVKLKSYRETDKGTDIIVHVPDQKLGRVLTDKSIKTAELRLDDGRMISSDQRKKAYATINDIALYTGYLPEQEKEWLKYYHISRTGAPYISLSDCSMDEARELSIPSLNMP